MIGFFKKGLVTQEEIPATSMPAGLAWHQVSGKGTGTLTVSFDFGTGTPEEMGVIGQDSSGGPLIVFGIADKIVFDLAAGSEFDVCYRYQEV